MRYIARALDIIGAVLFIAGACGLAYLAHPFLAVLVGGILLLVTSWLLEHGKPGDAS